MILAIDIGNTHTVLGFIEGGGICKTVRVATNTLKTDFEYAIYLHNMFSLYNLSPDNIDGAIISSVVPPLTGNLVKAVELSVKVTPLVVGKGIKTGVNLQIDDPGTAGADLVAAAAGALAEYKPPLCIIDMGTATTISVIDRHGAFIGGSICPGVALGLSALSSGTSQLPNVSLDAPKHCIGRNTVDSIKSGSILGAAAMIDGMVDRIESELGDKVTAVATGGIAASVIPLCRKKIDVNENLLLHGLWAIYKKNK